MKRFFFVSGVVSAAVLSIVVGTRISADAMAVIIGIVCGVLASIPTSVILVWALRQRDRQLELQTGGPYQRMGHYPPVVVVNGQGTNGYGSMMPPPVPALSSAAGGSRDFKVIGQENTESAGDFIPPFWDQG
ncbi:MAG: hypothetical protein Kow0031_27260 [Anaerolineae bacterium]